jgi:hypothetical protein
MSNLVFNHTDDDRQSIDVYLIDGNFGLTLPDQYDDQTGPIVWLSPADARALATAILREVSE